MLQLGANIISNPGPERKGVAKGETQTLVGVGRHTWHVPSKKPDHHSFPAGGFESRFVAAYYIMVY